MLLLTAPPKLLVVVVLLAVCGDVGPAAAVWSPLRGRGRRRSWEARHARVLVLSMPNAAALVAAASSSSRVTLIAA